jgi:restriction system protein
MRHHNPDKAAPLTDVTSGAGATQWWDALDGRIRAVLQQEWSSFYSEVLAEALGEYGIKLQQEIDNLRREFNTFERKLEVVRSELAIKDAVADATRIVKEARNRMPELEQGVRDDLRQMRRRVEETHTAIEPATARWSAEIGALDRKVARMRAQISGLEYALNEQRRERERVAREPRNEAERQQRQEERRRNEQAAMPPEAILELTPAAQDFLVVKRRASSEVKSDLECSIDEREPSGSHGIVPRAVKDSIMLGFGALGEYALGALPDRLMVQARKATLSVSSVIIPDKASAEGVLIKSTSLVWDEIVRALGADWSVAYGLPPEKWEEIVAGAFKRAQYDEVTLTPRSGDHGRDVIAVKHGVGCVKIIGSVKRYGAGKLVPYDDIRALLGVMSGERNASKGIITTTSDFPPKRCGGPLHRSVPADPP